MWTSSDWSVPGALRRACDPQLAPSAVGIGVSVRRAPGHAKSLCNSLQAFCWRAQNLQQRRIWQLRAVRLGSRTRAIPYTGTYSIQY